MAAPTCTDCGGTGQGNCVNPYCVQGHDQFKKDTCQICNGTGKGTCGKCNGKGTT